MCPLSIEISVSSDGCPVTSTDSKQAEIITRRVTRGAAKVASLEFGPKLKSSPKPSLPSFRKRGRSEAQPIGQQRGKGRPDESKASAIKPTPRRSLRLFLMLATSLNIIFPFSCPAVLLRLKRPLFKGIFIHERRASLIVPSIIADAVDKWRKASYKSDMRIHEEQH
jgi:hypothetical protein